MRLPRCTSFKVAGGLGHTVQFISKVSIPYNATEPEYLSSRATARLSIYNTNACLHEYRRNIGSRPTKGSLHFKLEVNRGSSCVGVHLRLHRLFIRCLPVIAGSELKLPPSGHYKSAWSH